MTTKQPRTAAESLANRTEMAREQIARLQEIVDALATHPNGSRDWGFAGSMGYIVDRLTEINEGFAAYGDAPLSNEE